MWERIVTSLIIIALCSFGSLINSILRGWSFEEAKLPFILVIVLCLIFSILYISGVIFNR